MKFPFPACYARPVTLALAVSCGLLCLACSGPRQPQAERQDAPAQDGYSFAHTGIYVHDLDKSVSFYSAAFGLRQIRRVEYPDGSSVLVFLGDGVTQHQLELLWARDRKEPYKHGDARNHLAFLTDDYNKSLARHKAAGAEIAVEHPDRKIYFMKDPEGNLIEVMERRPSAANAGR